MSTIYTIGFSGKTLGQLIIALDAVGVRTIVDIRLWRASRFVPWASADNLSAALGDRYKYMPVLAPTKELLSAYKDGKIDWPEYERIYNELLAARRPELLFALDDYSGATPLDKICLLCTEKTADKCHRRLVVEYLSRYLSDIQIEHL